MSSIENAVSGTTIWNSGVRFENSIFHRQKFVYRRQRGCEIVPCRLTLVSSPPIFSIMTVQLNTLSSSFTPWLNGDTDVSDFTSILNNRVNNFLSQSGLTINDCILNSINSQWYLRLKIGNDTIINQYFYQGYGINDVLRLIYETTLIDNLYKLFQYGFTYTLNPNKLTITNLGCVTENLQRCFFRSLP
jgi:hypothetical protein